MRDVQWPDRGLGYLDLARATPLARDAAQLWLAQFIRAYENDVLLPDARILGTRISLPSDRSFTSYETATAGVLGPPLDASTDIPWQQASIDVVLDYPIRSDRSNFALEPQLARLGLQTTTVMRFITPNGAERAYQYIGDPGLIRLDPRWYHAAWQFVKLGVAHILGGIDHLLFVLCLVIPFRRWRPLVMIVTSFTVAHSITLASSALGVGPDALWFPPLIEALIAASIVYMALENIVGARLRRRWLIAFGFGLVHGFGFSFALRQSLQFAGSHLAVSLFTFNAGVEIGQLVDKWKKEVTRNEVYRITGIRDSGELVFNGGGAIFDRSMRMKYSKAVGDGNTLLREYEFTLPALDLAFVASALRAALVLVIIGGAAWGLGEAFRRLWRGSVLSDTASATQPGDV